jgi:hypothetical protein
LAAARARLAGAGRPQASPRSSGDAPSGASQTTSQPVADDADAMAAPAVLTPQQSAAVAQMIKRAQVATAHGAIMLPPGDSAYDLYRSALAIDGNNEAALQGLHALPGQAMSQFNQALGQGDLQQAGEMLENLSELSPGDASQSALSSRLASAWLDQAEKQLANGDRFGAMNSLDHARKLTPGNPRVQDLAARLQGGR